jgi:hypothetical protein
MWAVTSYYNPARFKQRLTNYRIFRANLGVPLVTVELSFDGRFELGENDSDILIQISGGAVLWQKERLLNLAIKSVPHNSENIAWIDCDVVFDRPDWMEEAELQLSKFNIVQLFSEFVDLESDGLPSNVRDLFPSGRGLISMFNGDARLHLDAEAALWENNLPYGFRATSTGIAWAARREIIENHGLYDAMIIGGGDRAMLNAMYGQFDKEMRLHHLNKARQEHYLKWAQPYHRAIAEKIGNVSGKIYHLWHGDLINRNYRSRHRLLANFDFEPDLDLVIGPNGAWRWARSRPKLERFLVNYFNDRAEDE